MKTVLKLKAGRRYAQPGWAKDSWLDFLFISRDWIVAKDETGKELVFPHSEDAFWRDLGPIDEPYEDNVFKFSRSA